MSRPPSEKRTAIDPPLSVQLHLTNRCNANCLFCWLHGRKQDSKELPEKRWLEIADEICKLGVPRATISGGGEPLLRAKLALRMMEKLSLAGIGGNLITNGTLISEEIAERIVESGWESVQVSIHAPNAGLHDRLMDKKGAFSLALRGIRNLARAKRRKGSSSPELGIRMVITRDNMFSLPGFIRLARSSGITKVSARMVNDLKTATKGIYALSEKDRPAFRKAIAQAMALAEREGVHLETEFDIGPLPKSGPAGEGNVRARLREKRTTAGMVTEGLSHPPECSSGCPEKDESAYCAIPFSELVIFANGTVSPCCNFFDLQFEGQDQRGGLLEDLGRAPLTKTWRDGFAMLRASMFSRQALRKECTSCSMDMRYWRSRPSESAWHQRFRHFEKHGRYAEGIQFGLDQLKARTTNPTLHAAIGEFYMEVKDFGNAIRHLTRASRAPISPAEIGDVVDFHLGRCYMETEEYGKALRAFRRNLKRSTSEEMRSRSRHLMALCPRRPKRSKKRYVCPKNTKKAEGDAKGRDRNAKEEDGREASADRLFHEEFTHFLADKRYEEGIRFAEEQLARHPGHPIILRYLGRFHMELGNYERALEVLRRLEKGRDGPEGLQFMLGICHLENADYVGALKRFKMGLKEAASEELKARIWYSMALCHRRLKRLPPMEYCLAKAKECSSKPGKEGRHAIDSWPSPFFHEEFRYLRKKLDYRGGIRFGTEQLKEHAECAVLHHYIGEFHMELCEYGKAIEHLSLAVRLNPIIEWTRFSLGKCYYLTREYDEAEKEFRKNIEITHDRLSHVHSWIFLAMVADAKGDRKACRGALKALRGFGDFVGNEIPMEREFLERLERKQLLLDGLVEKHLLMTDLSRG